MNDCCWLTACTKIIALTDFLAIWRLLLDICKISGLVIVNGILGDDKAIGRATRIMGDQSSVVYYVIATPKLFQITPFLRFMINFFNLTTNRLFSWYSVVVQTYFMNRNDALSQLKDTNQIVTAVNKLITQAADRVFRGTRGTRRSRGMAPRWYDAECRRLRSLAMKAGERLTSNDDRAKLTAKCKQYETYYASLITAAVWYGKVTDTLRGLYTKTSLRVKLQGWFSFLIRNMIGVHQGGVARGFLFRKYLWSGWIFKYTLKFVLLTCLSHVYCGPIT